jgi:hypothetical protein
LTITTQTIIAFGGQYTWHRREAKDRGGVYRESPGCGGQRKLEPRDLRKVRVLVESVLALSSPTLRLDTCVVSECHPWCLDCTEEGGPEEGLPRGARRRGSS